jgi:hypothetical protein
VQAAVAELEAIDADRLTDDALHALVLEEQRVNARFAAVRARHLAAWVERGAWAEDGSKAAWSRLARDCGLSKATAQTEVGRATRLRSMAATAASFADGGLSIDQVDLLRSACRPELAKQFERDEELLVRELPGLRAADGRKFIDYWVDRACIEADIERSRPDPVGRRLSAVRSFDGHFNVSGWLDPIAGTEFVTELESIERELFKIDWDEARNAFGPNARPCDLPRTGPQRRHDALVRMARSSRACRKGNYQKPDPLITVHAGLGTLTHMCELADGTVVSPSQVFPLLTSADIERIVFDGPSRVIDVGVRTRFFTGALRRALEVRDRHCQDPSDCDVPAEECEGDHIKPYRMGGLTTQENGRMLCHQHNVERVGHEPDERPPPDHE